MFPSQTLHPRHPGPHILHLHLKASIFRVRSPGRLDTVGDGYLGRSQGQIFNVQYLYSLQPAGGRLSVPGWLHQLLERPPGEQRAGLPHLRQGGLLEGRVM